MHDHTTFESLKRFGTSPISCHFESSKGNTPDTAFKATYKTGMILGFGDPLQDFSSIVLPSFSATICTFLDATKLSAKAGDDLLYSLREIISSQ